MKKNRSQWRRTHKALNSILFVSLLVLLPASTFAQSGYHIVDSLQLGGEGGWDYLTVDTSAGRVFISRSTHVQVVDLAKHALVGDIPNTNGVHGIALAYSVGKGYTSNGRDSTVTIFDLTTLKTLRTIKVDARNPDAIIFDPFSQRVFTFNGGSSNATAIDVKTDKVVGTVPLAGKPEFAASDLHGRMYVNIEDKSLVTEFDPMSLKVLNTWPLKPGEEPSGLAIDLANHCVFSVCGNKTMVVLDTQTGKILATLPIGQGVDGVAYDPEQHCAFSSNGEGTMTVVREDNPKKFTVIETVTTRRGARTVTVDEKTHRVYTFTAKFGATPQPTAEHPRPRPTSEPGTATLYVLGR